MEQQSSQEQVNIGEQSISILNLFRKRVPLHHDVTIETHKKLHQALCCTICLGLLKNCVYLRCSHRFCRDCIEDYIIKGKGDRNSCPKCRDRLSTKRDLHLDYTLIIFMGYAFGNANGFRNQVDKYHQKFVQKIFLKNPEKDRINRNKQQQPILSSKKLQFWTAKNKIKQNQPQQSKQQSILQSCVKRISERQIKKLQQCSPFIRQPNNNQENKNNNAVNFVQLQKQISQNNIFTNNLPNTSQQFSTHNLSPIKISDCQDQTPSIKETKQFLIKQLGQNYMKILVELSSSNCNIIVKILRLIDQITSPQLPFKTFKISMKTQVKNIREYISHLLNFDKISLFIIHQNNRVRLTNEEMSILQINEQYWKSYKGIEIFDMGDMVKWLENKQSMDNNQSIHRIFYYTLDYIK